MKRAGGYVSQVPTIEVLDVAKPRVLGSINAHAVHGDDNPAMAGEHFERRKSSYVEIGV